MRKKDYNLLVKLNFHAISINKLREKLKYLQKLMMGYLSVISTFIGTLCKSHVLKLETLVYAKHAMCT